MTATRQMALLDSIKCPADLKRLTPDQLIELVGELRSEIVTAVADNGGHLASNLGAVELTVALHFVFDAPKDKIIWDVSHQTYSHKILTGRRDKMTTLRQYKGLSGYAKREESAYDHFGAGHASTSISAALGFACARDLHKDDYRVVAVIGDGAMTGGLAFEGMNNAGSLKQNMLVILNDNTWSISRNVGAISKYLTGIMADEKFQKLRNEVWELTGKFKRRDKIRETIHALENSIKGFLVPGMLFERLGFRYFGPIDGHDLPLLIKTLRDIKSIPGPKLLHVATIKGKGYEFSESDAFSYHGVGKFDKVTGKGMKPSGGYPAYTKIFGETMIELAQKNERVIAITAAMSQGTGLDEFAQRFPERFYDVGIAEAHAACFSAAMAAEKAKPYLTVYSTFMQRAYDQVIHDMAIQNLPVTICMDRAGLVGNDGPTHHGVFDIAYLSTVPNVTLAAPKDGDELRSMLHHTVDHDLAGLVAIRYPRDNTPTPVSAEIEPIAWGTWEWMTDPDEVVVLAVGTMVLSALEATQKLSGKSIDISVVNARFIKPFDMEMLTSIAKSARIIFTVEEAQLRGGFGQAIAEYLLSTGFTGKFKALGIPDRFVTHGDRADLLCEVGLDGLGVAASIESFVTEQSKTTGGFLHRLNLRRNGAGIRRKDFLRNVG